MSRAKSQTQGTSEEQAALSAAAVDEVKTFLLATSMQAMQSEQADFDAERARLAGKSAPEPEPDYRPGRPR